MMCLYNRVLLENSRGCAGTEECYRRTWENVFVQLVHYKSHREALLIHKLLQENWGGCVVTKKYYRSTGETVLVDY